MKNAFLLLTLVLVYSLSYAQNDTRLGGFLAYGTDVESLGIGANAEFPIADKLTISPSLIYYFPKTEAGIKVNWFELNGNVNYYFVENDGLGFYGLAGLNYSNIKVSYDDSIPYMDDVSVSDGKVGINLGAGANFNIGKSITPFTELKYVLIDGGQLVLMGGIKFSI